MIEAIRKIPNEILDGQLEKIEENKGRSNQKQKYLIILLDDNFVIKKKLKGTYDEISEKENLNGLSKDLIKNSLDYIYNGRKGFGGQFGLYTCSPFHIKLGEKILEFFESEPKEGKDKIQKSKEALANSSLFSKFEKNKISNMWQNLKNNFLEFKGEFKLDKGDIIVFIPEEEEKIKYFKEEHQKYLEEVELRNKIDEENFAKFPFDIYEKFNPKHKILYSKFSKDQIYQEEDFNLIPNEISEKMEKFKMILEKGNYRKVLPLPLFEANTNIYQICFNDNSLLRKLQEIYKENNNKPFNYVLISSNDDGYRFENIINFNFKVDSLINKSIYDLKFNEHKFKNEINIIDNKDRKHERFELLFDIASIFWVIRNEEKNEYRQMSFFRPEIKNNAFLDRKLKENSESIINQIFKNNNEFINFRLSKIINSVLNEILHSGETQKQFSYPYGMKKLLLLSLKYETKKEKMKSKELKEIEDKLKKFRENSNLDEIESDFEAYLYAGLIFKHLVSASASGKTDLEIASKSLLSVSTTKQLIDKMVLLTTQYSHNLKVNPKMWGEMNRALLEHEFQDERVKNNLVPFFIGYYSDFWLSTEKQENLNNGETN